VVEGGEAAAVSFVGREVVAGTRFYQVSDRCQSVSRSHCPRVEGQTG
jgi:hypothetical protein